MRAIETQFAVLGGGSAGYAAAHTAAALGLDTVVIDGSDPLGGLCILRGCMPSKSLIESANRFLTLRHAEAFGLRAGDIQALPEKIQERKRALIDDFAGYRQSQLTGGPFELLRGTARFLDAHTLEVTPREAAESVHLHASTIVVSTGSVVSSIPLPGLEETGYWTSDDVLKSGHIPESITILGGGAIALEMAHYLEALGSRVAVIQRSPRILKNLDPDVSEALENALVSRGIALSCDTHLEKITGGPGEKTVHYTHRGDPASATSEEILLALGRTPATESLGLETTGVDVDGARIRTDPGQATSVPHIFAAGDVCSPHEIVHIAIEQGEIAARNAAVHLGKLPADARREIDYRLKLLGIFTQPQVASLGLTEAEAIVTGRHIRSASYPFDDHGKSMIRGETEGFVKLIADAASGEILGASAVGPETVELIHEIAVAMFFRATAGQLAAVPHYHPTLSEIWTYPAEELAAAETDPGKHPV